MAQPTTRPMLILSSPTASGKTEISVTVAEGLPVEIINADSRQVYKHLTVGTAKPEPGIRARIPHHFTDLLEPDGKWNAGIFAARCRELIPEISARGSVPFIVGGTGLYLKALIDGIIELPETDGALRDDLRRRAGSEGINALVAELTRYDPEYAAQLDLHNPHRIIRALEIIKQTGMTRREIERRTQPTDISFLWFGLSWERKALYERINRRVDRMLAAGLIEEVQYIRSLGYSASLNALQTVGYKEVFSYLDGEIDRAEMVRLIKRNTRRYAKRQMTWFRNEDRIQWIGIEKEEDMVKAGRIIIEAYSRISGGA